MDDKEPYHSNGGPSSGRVVVEIVNVESENDGHDYVARGHSDGAHGEDWFTAHAVDCLVELDLVQICVEEGGAVLTPENGWDRG